VTYCAQIREIVSGIEGRNIPVGEVWPFLRVVHVLSLDLTTSTKQSESQIKTMLANCTSEIDRRNAAETTWNALLSEVGKGMPQAKRYRYEDLPLSIRQRHIHSGMPEREVLRVGMDSSTFVPVGKENPLADDIKLIGQDFGSSGFTVGEI
jgi:hypothetical protein